MRADGRRRSLTARLQSLRRAAAQSAAVTTSARMWRRATRPQRTVALCVTGAVVVGLAVWVVVSPSGPPPRARQYLTFKACLLTDSQGITGKQAAPVWAGMQHASLKTQARVQYLSVFGASTVPNALPYVASLVQRHCDLVMAAGDVPVAAAVAGAARFPKARFVVIGGQGAGGNVTVVNSPPMGVPAAVAAVITHAVHGAST